MLGDDEIDAVLYAGCKYEDYEARRDAVYGLLRRSTILALLCIGRRSDLLFAFLLVFYYELVGLIEGLHYSINLAHSLAKIDEHHQKSRHRILMFLEVLLGRIVILMLRLGAAS